jgi:hypothetical protein
MVHSSCSVIHTLVFNQPCGFVNFMFYLANLCKVRKIFKNCNLKKERNERTNKQTNKQTSYQILISNRNKKHFAIGFVLSQMRLIILFLLPLLSPYAIGCGVP